MTGTIATYPVGGVAWDYAQYALGLEQLGFEVWYLEDSGLDSFDAERGEYGPSFGYGAGFLQEALATLSPTLAERWHVRGSGGESYGVDAAAVPELVADSDLFLNVSGGCLLREEYLPSPRKVLVDTDPGWNHFVTYPRTEIAPAAGAARSWRGHDAFFTYAERIGRRDCPLPDLGVRWQPTRPPVIADQWAADGAGKTWTTVLTWNNYPDALLHESSEYGTKAPEMTRIEDLPRLVDTPFELAVGGTGAPIGRWRRAGWSVVDASSVSRTPDDYRAYVQSSRGELSVAKKSYVSTRSGWFSCRSVCYLAAGRPAVLQDTGFSELVPTGEGLLAFEDVRGAAAAIEAVEADYPRHSEAARQIAEGHFAAELVLGELLERVGI